MGIKITIDNRGVVQEKTNNASSLVVSVPSTGITASVIGGVNSVNGSTGDVTLTTSNISEGSNLYFTDVRVENSPSVVTASAHLAQTGNVHNATALDINAVPLSYMGSANGVATLNSASQVPASQLAIGDPFNFHGVWNANTNTPTLASGVGDEGDYYLVNVSGTTNLDGISSWNIGDTVVFASGAWHQVSRADLVYSVNGFQGIVSLDTDDINEGAANLYYLDSRVTGNVDVAANTAARHTHSNSSVLNNITDAGSGIIISTTERGRLLTQDEKNAIVGTSGSANAGNRFVTDIDPRLISGSVSTGNLQYYNGNKWLALSNGASGSFLHGNASGAPDWRPINSALRRTVLVTPDVNGRLTYSDASLSSAKSILTRINVRPSGSANSRVICRLNNDATARYA